MKSFEEMIIKMAEMHLKKGVISEEEFNQLKQQLGIKEENKKKNKEG